MSAFSHFFQRLLSFWLYIGSRNCRVILVDIIVLSLTVYLGYALRLTFFISGYRVEMLGSLFLYTVSVVFLLYAGKIYSIMWPQASVEEYARLFKYYCAGTVLFAALLYLAKGYLGPRSSMAILASLGIIFLGGVRATWRMAQITRFREEGLRCKALIIGAGDTGSMLARDLLRRDSKLQPVGFIDDNPRLHGLYVASLKVLGGTDALPSVLTDQRIEVVLIAIPSAPGTQLSKYLEILSGYNVSVRVLPSLVDLADGQVTVSRLRAVSLEDLLRRDPVTLDDEGIAGIVKGKTVLVTGAGGSISSEICRQVLANEPKMLLALGHGEYSIYLLMESLAAQGITIPVQPIIADVADLLTIEAIFREYRPALVFHAAAHKHVPLMQENPREVLRVNSFGTWNLTSMAGKYGAERLVMISTDKAVNPTSVMGATKRAAERLLLSVQQEYPDTRYMVVRFGNVLGSRGSVVPKFEKQIEAGGPVTVTHPDMKRYFMLIPEAVSLVLQAAAMGCGGELFVLDMGEPVNIAEMAKMLIRLYGYEPGKDVKIVYTGIRPGEKLYEELFYDPGYVDSTAHAKIFLSRLMPEEKDVLSEVKSLLDAVIYRKIDDEALRARIMTLGSAA